MQAIYSSYFQLISLFENLKFSPFRWGASVKYWLVHIIMVVEADQTLNKYNISSHHADTIKAISQ